MKKGLDLKELYELMFGSKIMFKYAVKEKDSKKIKYWAESIFYWRNQIKKFNAIG